MNAPAPDRARLAPAPHQLLRRIHAGGGLSDDEVLALQACDDLPRLMGLAGELRDAGFGSVITYSPKVFLPLTHLCRDVCRYCTFARPPRRGERAYLTLDEVLRVAEAGARAGCTEALFTLGDQPEARYEAARDELASLGHDSTLSYLRAAAAHTLEHTGLLPHLNPGLMQAADLTALRSVSASMGLMLETSSERLTRRGGPHHGCPDKLPARRLHTMQLAGELRIPFTSGLLIGIGETRLERLQTLLALRALHQQHGHLQEVIVQNFRPKPGTPMAQHPEPSLDDHLWTVAVARLVLGPHVSIQVPPNLVRGALSRFIEAGINDWGGVSPVTADFVNPEAPWPSLESLRRQTEATGRDLVPRLPVYPAYLREAERWLDPAIARVARSRIDADGLVRASRWTAGGTQAVPMQELPLRSAAAPLATSASACATPFTSGFSRQLERAVARAEAGSADEATLVQLLGARGERYRDVCAAADALRRRTQGDRVSYVVNRNINYTNICAYRCQFCAFAKGRASAQLRGPAYELPLEEIASRAREAWDAGATEVCMQGGIHPRFTGRTYLDICRAVKAAVPGIHVHAFSPLEVWQGAHTLGLPVQAFLEQLAEAGLRTLPGTAAEILDDEIRQRICPDKVTTAQWLEVMETAHRVGLKSTATILFGHIEQPVHVARHLLRVRALQQRTGGFTEFVPLPFVAEESPLYRKGGARQGPTFREVMLMHAVARLALHGAIGSIQVSWVKAGPEGAVACLDAGANDLGGTLMDESISRAAGAAHGQELTARRMEALIRGAGREPWQRTTLYEPVDPARRALALAAAPRHACGSAGAAVAVPLPTPVPARSTRIHEESA